MKFNYYLVTSLMLVLGASSTIRLQAEFDLVNKTRSQLTLLLDYSDEKDFIVVQVPANQSTPIRFNLTRIIAYKGTADLDGVSDGRLSKINYTYPSNGAFVLKYVSGRDDTAHQPAQPKTIDDDMHVDETDTQSPRPIPSWKIVELVVQNLRTLALWRVE